MQTPILVLNSGSSSIKFSLFEASDDSVVEFKLRFVGEADGVGSAVGKFWIKDADGNKLHDDAAAPLPTRDAAFKLIANALKEPPFPYPAAIGHRMVSGGPELTTNQIITPAFLDEMERYVAFAPLHMPISIYIMRQAAELFAGVPNFACFDSAFHATLPEVAARLALPEEYWKAGIRKYGAHGLSYESIVHQLGDELPPRLIVAHLGNGASITAIRDGKSIDTSMGLTPTGGIVSGTRTGDIDPGVMLYILRSLNARSINEASINEGSIKQSSNHEDADQLETIFSKQSGLLGISGFTNDMRHLREAIASGNQQAKDAVAVFTYVARKFIGSYMAVLGGLDMLVFTGGIGENDHATRAEICAGLENFGILMDEKKNNCRGKAIVSKKGSAVLVQVIPAQEDRMIAMHAYKLLKQPTKSQ